MKENYHTSYWIPTIQTVTNTRKTSQIKLMNSITNYKTLIQERSNF